MGKNLMKKGLIINIVSIAIFAIVFISLFFNVLKIERVNEALNKYTDYYSLISLIKEYKSYYLICAVILYASLLTSAGLLVYGIIKKNYYILGIKISSGVLIVSIASYVAICSIYMLILIFAIIVCNMLIIAFDVKENKKKKVNAIIFLSIYILFAINFFLGTIAVPR